MDDAVEARRGQQIEDVARVSWGILLYGEAMGRFHERLASLD